MRLSEVYTSIQGEGPNVGKMTTFTRFGGCNMKCPGWPCDTPYAIFPDQYRHEWEPVTPEEVYERIRVQVPKHVCLTGGEPLLQPQSEFVDLVKRLSSSGYSIDVFTNGSFDFKDYGLLRHLVTIIMDWKLRGSGEASTKLEQRYNNLNYLRPHDAVKFVCDSPEDFDEACALLRLWGPVPCNIYFGAAWGTGYTEADVVRDLIQRGMTGAQLNVQVHKYLWPEKDRGI